MYQKLATCFQINHNKVAREVLMFFSHGSDGVEAISEWNNIIGLEMLEDNLFNRMIYGQDNGSSSGLQNGGAKVVKE